MSGKPNTVALSTLAKERSMADMRADCAHAFTRSLAYHNELRSIYRYMMPWRQSTIDRASSGGGKSEGQSITDYIFDATGVSAAANYAGTAMADWCPMNQEFFKLEAGPLIPDGEDKAILNRTNAQIAAQVHAVSARPQISMLESFYDHFAGTGALFLGKGDATTLINSAAVPSIEIAIEDGPWDDPWHVYWRRKYLARDIPGLWVDGEVSDAVARVIRENGRSFVDVVQYTFFEQASKTWQLRVWVEGHGDPQRDPPLWQQEFKTCPWMLPRMFKMPGESHGRGLAHLALPFVKTANRSRELQLKAAIIAILGIWLRRNDKVFNPKTAVFDAGAMWTVSSTGGVLGPSIARLPTPQDFDIPASVQSEERDQIRRVLLDDELPDERDPIRSPTEIAARLRRTSRNRGGSGARINHELITPYVRRCIEILQDQGTIKERISIDQIVTKCTVTAPAAAAQRTDKVEAWVNYTQIISMLFGPQAAALLTKIEAIPEMGRNLGIPEKHLPAPSDLKKIEEVLANAAAQHALAQQEAGGRKSPSPGQQFVNGGAH
jgi:hypothetical protein